MKIGLLAFKEMGQREQLDKCIATLSTIHSTSKWRFGKSCYDPTATAMSELAAEVVKRTLDLSKPGDQLLSFSASPQTGEFEALAQFEIYNQHATSTVRIRLELPGTLSARVERCSSLMMQLVKIWKPQSAYVTSVEELQGKCPQLLKVFPSGYAIYRDKQINANNTDSQIETIKWEYGSCIKFQSAAIDNHEISCDEFKTLIQFSGGIDERFSLLI